MTLVNIDIKNVASETHPDDRVVFYSPELREHPNGGLVSTAETVVPLSDGMGDVELAPGPVTVTFQCRGIADTKPKRGTVPDEGPVELGDVIAGDFVYTPAVVSAAVQARNEAQAAADRAEAGADRVGTAEQVEQWATAAATSASTASDSASTATSQATAAKNSATTATTQATSATASKNAAATSATNAAGNATTATTQATAAATSASTASDSASTAAAARNIAVSSATAAAGSATTAGTAATTATNKATEAGLAADRAEQATAGKADLIGGKVPTSQIPEVALTKPFPVSTRAEMLALDTQEGDIAIISTGADKGSYILGAGPSTSFSSWLLMAVSADVPVQSVNGQVGNVNLGASDVGASPTGHTHTPASLGAAPASHTHTKTQISNLNESASAVANSMALRDSGGRLTAATPTGDGHLTPKSYVDARSPKIKIVASLPSTLVAGTMYVVAG